MLDVLSSRRSLLRAGALAIGGVALPDLMRLQAFGAAKRNIDHRQMIEDPQGRPIWLTNGKPIMELWS